LPEVDRSAATVGVAGFNRASGASKRRSRTAIGILRCRSALGSDKATWAAPTNDLDFR